MRRPTNPIPEVRLLPQGTRVILIARAETPGGFVSHVRLEPHLKTYVITCDDGVTVYASGHELAREDDPSRAPVARPPA
jgi:hypothetical protein